MNESENYKFKLPSRDSEDIADINEISDNFRSVDQILKDQEVELEKKIEGSVATEISNNSNSTEFPPASLVFEEVSDLSRLFYRKIAEIKSVLDKRVTNLEQGIIPSPFETDSTVAYQKAVPTNALPYAEVEKIGGMTRTYEYYEKGDHLANSGSAGFYGDLWDDKVVTVATAYADGVVTFTDGSRVYDAWEYEDSLSTLKVGDLCIFYTDTDGITILCKTELIQELRSAPVTEVESVGANLIDLMSFATSVVTTTLNNDGSVTFKNTSFTAATVMKNYTSKLPSGTYTITNIKGHTIYLQTTSTDYSNIITVGSKKTFEYDGVSFLRILFADLSANEEIVCQIMLNRGSEPISFVPYKQPISFPIPTEVQVLDGYGWGINESVYNYIGFWKKQFAKHIGGVDLGTLTWHAGSVTSRFYCPLPTAKHQGEAICSIYDVRYENADKVGYLSNLGSYVAFVVNDSAYTDAATFKAAMSGVMLYYELAEPIITDISDLLSEDNYIGVEGGGTVTFKNEYEYDVPSEITFKIKGANV